MPSLHDAWLARQRARWMRPNAHLYVRPDAHRFLPPGAQRLLRPDWKRLVPPGFDPLQQLLESKANFNPNQPRVPKGNPDGGQWTSAGGGGGSSYDEPGEGTDGRAIGESDFDDGAEHDDLEDEGENAEQPGEHGVSTETTGTRVRYRIVGLPEPALSQLGRLVDANARYDQSVQIIRQVDPNWRAQTASAYESNSNEGIVRHAESRALEAEAHARRLGIGGNLGPPLQPPPFSTNMPTTRPFNGPEWINAYRTLANTRDLFGSETWGRDQGTVSVTEFGGVPVFGVNRNAPTYTSTDLAAAYSMRDTLIAKYPREMQTQSIGQFPNNSLFHAEATVLLRSARSAGGTLNNRALEIHTDRIMCASCEVVLPKLGLELGNPVVTFTNPHNRERRTFWNGEWLP